MLKLAWYLIDVEFLTEPVPDLDGPDAEAATALLAAAEAVLGDEGLFDPVRTTVAVRLSLISAMRLHDAATHAAGIHSRADLVHLVHGLTLLHAYLTQTVQKLADHTRSIAWAGSPTAGVDRQTADALSTAGEGGEFVTSDLKRAYLALAHTDR
ncbi:hypothetical protein [Asanoa iriomotensis]|uniref:Uncharacterized protein n=1 Tax=Asanoa iriomotensis TaxID=234613 RepID=A0ABQ4C1J6_9ACTN|nr:hypothetical protein [Asanoa iriomotensis]GIF56637.1 hypothetical protein Air01nite_27320 [Asanoa iriomotensis]